MPPIMLNVEPEQRTEGEPASLWSQVLTLSGFALTFAVLTAVLWPAIQTALESSLGLEANILNWLGAAIIAAAISGLIGVLVYFVAKRTLWELAELLVVPLALAVIGFWLSTQQDARQLEVENDRAQDVALQAYLDQMSTLLVERDLRDAALGSEVRTLARARTLSVLERLEDPDRKAQVIRFLIEARLVQAKAPGNEPGAGVVEKAPIISLATADLRGVDLSSIGPETRIPAGVEFTYLPSDLSGADLDYADLSGADLTNADLYKASLIGANLSCADLSGIHLGQANLAAANLRHARGILEINTEMGFSEVYLEDPDFEIAGATMPNGKTYEQWVKSNDTQAYEAWLNSNDRQANCPEARE